MGVVVALGMDNTVEGNMYKMFAEHVMPDGAMRSL